MKIDCLKYFLSNYRILRVHMKLYNLFTHILIRRSIFRLSEVQNGAKFFNRHFMQEYFFLKSYMFNSSE